MRLTVLALAGIALTHPAAAQRYVDCAVIERISQPPDATPWSYSVEMVAGRVQTLISQRQGSGTVASSLQANPMRPGVSIWLDLFGSSGIEPAEAVFQEAGVQPDGTILYEEWAVRGRPARRDSIRLRLRCPASPR